MALKNLSLAAKFGLGSALIGIVALFASFLIFYGSSLISARIETSH